MPELATREFWKDLQPIPDCFKPDAKPEVYLHNAPTEDERLYVPFTETVKSRPLWISPSENRWCDILMATSAGLVNRHYHPHEVFAYTISGKWGYLEHDWTATAGDFVYETPGEGHTLGARRPGGCAPPRRPARPAWRPTWRITTIPPVTKTSCSACCS